METSAILFHFGPIWWLIFIKRPLSKWLASPPPEKKQQKKSQGWQGGEIFTKYERPKKTPLWNWVRSCKSCEAFLGWKACYSLPFIWIFRNPPGNRGILSFNEHFMFVFLFSKSFFDFRKRDYWSFHPWIMSSIKNKRVWQIENVFWGFKKQNAFRNF